MRAQMMIFRKKIQDFEDRLVEKALCITAIGYTSILSSKLTAIRDQ